MSIPAYTHGQEQGIRDRVATAVYATTNYVQFLFDPINRPVDEKKVIKLFDAIQERNLLADNPILVDLDYRVLDGQHRLKAAEAAHLPIYYFFASETTIDDVAKLNNTRNGWTLANYISSYCERGNPEYIALREFMKQNPHIGPNAAVDLCNYGDKFNLRERFADGKYECNDIPFATLVANAMLDFRAIGCKFWNQQTFVYSVAQLFARENYDHSRMMDKLSQKPQLLRAATTVDDYMEIFTEAYNFRSHASGRVEFKRLNTSDRRYRPDRKTRPLLQPMSISLQAQNASAVA